MTTPTPLPPTIPECLAGDDPDAMYEALEQAGCLVIGDMMSPSSIASVRSDLAETFAKAKVGDDVPEDFYPGNTRRVIALAHRSPTVRDWIMDPRVEALCDRHLGPNCDKYQLHITAGLEIGPGARHQVLHREEDPFPFFTPPRPNLVLATMWAVTDFTADNGGTRLVPGSHRWDASRTPQDHEIVVAEMPAGSALVWLGGTLHGAGANVTLDVWRYGVILTFSLGWLRQEENQHLSMPLADALALPETTRERLGFAMDYNGDLGFYDATVTL